MSGVSTRGIISGKKKALQRRKHGCEVFTVMLLPLQGCFIVVLWLGCFVVLLFGGLVV